MANTYLDPQNQAFVDALQGTQPLYEKSFADARAVLEDVQKYQPSSDVSRETIRVDFEGSVVDTVIFRPSGATGVLKTIFYTHGGGWILGSPTAHGALVEDLVRNTGAAVVFPYYTPAPEAQYPTQFEQSYRILEYIVANASKHELDARVLGLAGDSVGGNMAIAMVQLAQSRSLPAKIATLILFYPVTDTHSKSETYKTFKDGPYLAEKTMDWMIEAFLPNKDDRRSALASPLQFASDEVLKKFPPTTIFLSGADPLIGEGEAFGRRLQQLGIEAAILKAEGVIHDYVLLEPVRHNATARAVVELASFKLRQSIGSSV